MVVIFATGNRLQKSSEGLVANVNDEISGNHQIFLFFLFFLVVSNPVTSSQSNPQVNKIRIAKPKSKVPKIIPWDPIFRGG